MLKKRQQPLKAVKVPLLMYLKILYNKTVDGPPLRSITANQKKWN